jgi:hypothetical protein
VASERDVYEALIREGLDMSQAVGIMANIENESGFDPEALNPGGPAAGVGLVQWETSFYPAAAGYRTGNVVRDLETQAKAIAAAARHLNLTGSAQQVAGTWAADFERCAGCQPGGAQYLSRVANAGRIWNQAKSGNWPAPGGSGITGGGGSSSSSSGASPAQLTAFLTSSSGGVLADAGALIHGSAVVLDRAFGLFAPGQGWRITFGAAAVLLLWLSWRAFS